MGLGGIENHEKALKEYTNAINIDPKPHWYFERSIVYLRLKQKEKAMKDINIAIKKDPYNPMFLTRKGDIYATFGKFDEAIGMYDKALESDPINKDIYNKKEGAILAKEKQFGIKKISEKGMYG